MTNRIYSEPNKIDPSHHGKIHVVPESGIALNQINAFPIRHQPSVETNHSVKIEASCHRLRQLEKGIVLNKTDAPLSLIHDLLFAYPLNTKQTYTNVLSFHKLLQKNGTVIDFIQIDLNREGFKLYDALTAIGVDRLSDQGEMKPAGIIHRPQLSRTGQQHTGGMRDAQIQTKARKFTFVVQRIEN